MAANSSDLDGLRSGLEASVANLQKLLRHWRTWEAEYEGLQETLSGMKEDGSQQHLEEEAFECEGELLITKEIKELLEDNGRPRTKKQILGRLSRRIDYVQDNVKATEKRLEAEQEKLDKANFVDHRDEGGFPLTEITEELDEEDNIISTSVSKPGEAAPKIIEAMRQSGLTDEIPAINTESQGKDKKASSSSDTDQQINGNMAQLSGSVSNTSKRKSVSFAESPEVIEPPPDPTISPIDGLKKHQEEAHGIQSTEEGLPLKPIIPENDSPEDAALRQEMIRYNMEEVGNVVAEMDLYDLSDGDYDDDDDDDNFDAYGDEEDEDEFGRTTVSVVTEEYREKMLGLERNLNARSIINIGKEVPDALDIDAEAKANTTQDRANVEDQTQPEKRKGVRFAESLDIQEMPSEKPTGKTKTPATTNIEPERPVTTEIVERQAPSNGQPSNVQPPKKVSKFKAARANQGLSGSTPNSTGHSKPAVNGPLAMQGLSDRLIPARQAASTKFLSIPSEESESQDIPKVPNGKTHADVLVERPARESESTVKEPDDFDPALLNQQVVTEHNRMRNRMIQKEDGFMSIDKEDLEDEDGRPRMSRFKAARLTHS